MPHGQTDGQTDRRTDIVTSWAPVGAKSKEVRFFGSDRSPRSHNVRLSVRSVQTCLELSIFIFLTQILKLSVSHFNSISIRVTPVRDCRYGQIIEKTKVNKKLGALYPSPNAPVLKEGFKIGLVLQLIHITWATTTLIYPTIYSYNKLVHINAPANFQKLPEYFSCSY